MKRDGRRIVMVTAYDYPSGKVASEAGVELVLVGDSAAMTVLGHHSTVPATIDEMLMLTRASARGSTHPLVIADLPFMSYQVDDRDAILTAGRFVKEGGADAVKMEGAGPTLDRILAVTQAGIPVMGHLGLTPQTATALGGFKAQGRTAAAALELVERRARDRGRRRLLPRAGVRAGRGRAGRHGAPRRSPPSASAPARAATARCSSTTTCSATASRARRAS